jgi:uncharacterized protein YbaR (Trm112 family)
MPKIRPELLSVLRCPVTGSPLVQEGEELVSTAAGESGVKLRYTIEDGIPLLLPPELLQAAKAAGSDEHDPVEHYPVEYYQAGHDPAAGAAPTS